MAKSAQRIANKSRVKVIEGSPNGGGGAVGTTYMASLADGLMTVIEAAEFLRLSRSSIYQLMDSGKLGYVKIGKARRIPRRALMELVAVSWVGPKPASADAAAENTNANES